MAVTPAVGLSKEGPMEVAYIYAFIRPSNEAVSPESP